MNSNKLKMFKCEKLTNKYVPSNHTEKSVYFPVTHGTINLRVLFWKKKKIHGRY